MTRHTPNPSTLKHKFRITVFASLVFILAFPLLKGCNQDDETPLFIIKSR